MHGWTAFGQYPDAGRMIVSVRELFADSPAALLRQLHFLASLRDQYSAVRWQTSADLQLHWLLRSGTSPPTSATVPAPTRCASAPA